MMETTVDIMRNRASCLNLTLVSGNMSNLCEWNIITDSNLGGNHFPILCSINFYMHVHEGCTVKRWCFPKADWGEFRACSTESNENN